MERKPGQRGLVRVAACILALLLPLPSSWASSPFAGVGVDGGSTDAVGAPPPKRGGFAPASDVVAVPVAEPSGDTRSSTAPSGDFRAPAATDGRSAPEVPFPGTRGKPFQPPKLMVPRVLGMYPDQLTQGTSYSVTLNGENLNPTLKVDFGAGILTKGAPVQLYGGKLKVVIDVLPFADTGKRKLKIGTPFSPLGEQTVEFEVKQKMAMATQSGPKAVQVKFPPADLKIVKGVIQLIAPAWRKQIGQEKQEKDKISGKPLGPPVPIWQTQLAMIDDALLFVWQEQNQGMAERFEIRFFKGDKLLVKRDIPVTGESGQPHYRPDAALLEALFNKLQPGQWGGALAASLARSTSPSGAGAQLAKAGGSTPGTGPKPLSPSGTGAQVVKVGSLEHALSLADISWEVAGFRSYAKNGVAKSALADLPPLRLAAGFAPKSQVKGYTRSDASQHATQFAMTETVELEVAISERWPLYLPDAPTGLGCPSAISAGLDAQNIDKAMDEDGKLATVTGFVLDRFEIQGKLNLAGSPYAAQVDTTRASIMQIPPSTEVATTTWSFDNVFVDWGDGTQERLSARMQGDAGDYERGATVDFPVGAIDHVHRYTDVGTYTVRLFQLGEDDIQGGGQQLAAWSTDNGPTQFGNPYALAGGSQAQAAQAEQEYGQAVAKRAYMVFCKPLTIQHRTDPAANGPLKLVDIAVTGVTLDADAAKQPPSTTKQGKKPAASGGGLAESGSAGLTLEQAQLRFDALTLLDGVPAYTTCDYQLTPAASLRYVGQGKVRTRWYVDNHALPPDADRDVGPSDPRPDAMLKMPAMFWGPPRAKTANLLAQSPVGLEQRGLHQLRVEAEAVPDSLHLHGLVKAAQMGDKSAQAALAQAAKEDALPKLGVLAVPKVPPKGGPVGPGPVINLSFDQPPVRLAAAGFSHTQKPVASDVARTPAGIPSPEKNPPRWAVSQPQPYKVVGHDPAQPCTFDFPVDGGNFKVVGLQEPGGKPNVARVKDRYSGSGDLLVPVPGGGGVQKAPVEINSWKVAEDGLTVLEGQFSITAPGLDEVLMPALLGHFTRLDGVAGDRVEAWLDAKLANSDLKEVESASAVPYWSGVKATLSPTGDWYAPGLTMPKFLVYDSGARMRPNAITLDLSTQEGASPGAKCGADGNAWLGIDLGSAAELTLFNFDMVGEPASAAVSNWGIDGAGLCGGPTTTGAKEYLWHLGKIGWDDIEAHAENGVFTATYKGLWVHVPWLDSTLTGNGDPVLNAGKGQGPGGISLALNGGAQPLTHGPVTLRASDLIFTQTPLGPGPNPASIPAASAHTCFDFQGESKVFAQDVCFDGLYFGLDGKAYFKGAAEQTFTLTGKSGNLSQGTATLKQVTVGTSNVGTQRLRFDFLTNLSLSPTLSSGDGTVSYQVDQAAGGQYTGSGPATGPFELHFNSGVVKATIKPFYTGPTDGTSLASNPVQLALADLGHESDAPFMVALGQGDKIVFRGKVDLTQFQMPESLHGEFLLGYHGATDFWATTFNWKQASGIVLVPGVLSLYEFGGGLGYHVTETSLLGGNLDNVQFSPDAVPVVNAMALVGTGIDQGFLFAARGNLNIKPGGAGGGVKMEPLTAWLLTNDHSGTGPINGNLGYGGGVFFGNLGGKWGPPGLDQHIYVEADPGAIGFSVGGGDWYFRAGTKQQPITGHVLILDQGAWMNLSKSDGYRVGAKAQARFPNITCDGGLCAYAEGLLSLEAAITTDPLQFSANGGGSVDVRGCALGFCGGYGTGLNVNAGAPNPVKFDFSVSIDGYCPLFDHAGIKVHVLPTPKFVDDVVFCDLF